LALNDSLAQLFYLFLWILDPSFNSYYTSIIFPHGLYDFQQIIAFALRKSLPQLFDLLQYDEATLKESKQA